MPKRKKISKAKKRAIYYRDGGKCVYCKRDVAFSDKGFMVRSRYVRLYPTGAEVPLATIDHKQPLCAGGSNAVSNLALACFDCNNSRNHEFQVNGRLAARKCCFRCHCYLAPRGPRKYCRTCRYTITRIWLVDNGWEVWIDTCHTLARNPLTGTFHSIHDALRITNAPDFRRVLAEEGRVESSTPGDAHEDQHLDQRLQGRDEEGV